MSEKIKGIFGHPERAEEVKAWLRSQGAETIPFQCNLSDTIYCVIDGKVVPADEIYENLLDIVALPPETHNFKPFDRVLVRYGENDTWKCTLFSHLTSLTPPRYRCIDNAYYYCIPYEGNEKLLGTTENPN